MSFFDWFRRGKKKKKGDIKALWDAASMSETMRRNFRGADILSADQSLSYGTRRVIASRVRFEVENNSFAAGIVSTLTSHVVGRDVTIELEPTRPVRDVDDEAVRYALDRREARFREWALAVRFNRLLTLARRAKCCDGECFILLTRNENLPNENKLFPVIYEAGQCHGIAATIEPLHAPNGATIEFDGIKYDRFGNPTEYCIWNDLDFVGLNGQGVWHSAANVLHYAHIIRPGQHRGVSELASSIAVFNDLRRFSNASLASAEAAAEMSFCLKTDLAAIGEDGQRIAQAVEPGTFIEAARAGGMALPEGWELQQLQPSNPTSNYTQYLESKVREAARCLNMPLMVALADSSGGNYSSSRADQQIWARKVDRDREELKQELIGPIYRRWVEFDRLAHPTDYAFDAVPVWGWQPFVSLDPVKDENAAALRLKNGVSALSQECARLGLDWENVMRQRAREKALAEKLGLNVAEPATETQLNEERNGEDETRNASA